MRLLFILTFLANIVATLILHAMLPDRVAIHFGADGLANGWAPNYVDSLLMTGLHVLLFCSFYFSPRLVLAMPAKWINLPNKSYWLQPVVLQQTRAKVANLMWQFGVGMFLFLLVISLLSFQANMASPVRLYLPAFYLALSAFLIFTVWWTIVFFRSFRLPKTKDDTYQPMQRDPPASQQ